MPASEQVRAVVVDNKSPGKLVIAPAPIQPRGPTDVTVKLTAISLNRGEIKRAMSSRGRLAAGLGLCRHRRRGGSAGQRAQRSARALSACWRSGAWAERIRAPAISVAEIPAGVTDAQAATLPVAGLTALHALRKGGLLLGKKVLVDGASGGVGHLAVQLAKSAGAIVYGHVRREDQRALIEKSCTGGVIVGASLEAARASGPYRPDPRLGRRRDAWPRR